MEQETAIFNCPKCGEKVKSRQDWIDHFVKKHKEIEKLRVGDKVMDLKKLRKK